MTSREREHGLRGTKDSSEVAYNYEQQEQNSQGCGCSAEGAMTIHRRTGLILAGITVTLLIVFVFAVPVLLNVDRYRPKAISYLEQIYGKRVEIGRLTVTFSPNVTIHVEDLGVKSPPLFPLSYILKVA